MYWCCSPTWQTGVNQLHVLLHGGQGLVPGTVDGYLRVQAPFVRLSGRQEAVLTQVLK